MNNAINSKDFAKCFGESEKEFKNLDSIEAFISSFDFDYEFLTQTESDHEILKILRLLDQQRFDPSGYYRKEKWEKGWEENLRDFIQGNYNDLHLIPKYYKPSNISRYNSKFVRSQSVSFQYDFFQVLRFYIAQKYLQKFDSIFEFACGPGHNIVALGKLLKNAALFGFDWAESSSQILKKISEKLNINCSGGVFDFFNPDYDVVFPSNSAVITFGGLEQTSNDYKAFLRYLIEKKPDLCVNVEPISEFYEESILIDYIGSKYHNSRNYLDGYLSKLLLLKKKGIIEIQKAKRVPFGGIYHEGWSIIVWRPL